YANECAEVRKMSKILLRAQMALEQVMLRLETVEEFGDVIVVMGPVAGVVHSLKTQLAGVIPEVSYELGEIGEELNKIVVDVGESTGHAWEISSTGEEAQKILDDAAAVSEQRMKERFPDLPTIIPTAEGSHQTTTK
ncbi:MAG: Snf7 family protein, partial [Candidatus Bathyarchaeia archaeon]